MKYKVCDLMYEISSSEIVKYESDEIANCWKFIQSQHWIEQPSLVIVREFEVVAGESSLLDKMIKHHVYDLENVRKLANA